MDGVRDQSGRANVLLLVIMAVMGVGLGVSIVMNYLQLQQADQDKRLLKGEITDLRYQLKQDQQTGATPAPSPSSTPAPTPTPTPSVLGDAATPTPTPEPATAKTATTTRRVRLRAGASTTSAELDWVSAGTNVTLGNVSNGQWQEVTASGKHGYIYKTYLKY